MKKLRIAFLVDDTEVNYYVADLVKYVKAHCNFESPVFITGYAKKHGKSLVFRKIFSLFKQNPIKSADQILRSLLLKLIKKVERHVVLKKFPNYYKKVDFFEDQNIKKLYVNGNWSKSGHVLRFDGDDITKIKNLNLDCIIRCGSGILKGEILDVAKFGMLSFHHGDNRVNRGGPSGFWEVLNDIPSSGFIIQKLNEELDGGEVLLRGNIMTREFWLLNNAQLLEKSNEFFKRLLEDLAVRKYFPTTEGVRLHGDILLKIDSSSVLIKYFLTILIPKAYEIIKNKILSSNITRWSVAYARHNNFSKSLWRYNEIKNPKGRFLADPFVFTKNDIDYIFVEDLFFSDNKGRISAIRLEEGGYNFLGVVLEESFHLSFPFIFDHDEDVYMIPETYQSGEIRLYKCQNFPMEWSLETILIEGVSAVDTMITMIDGKWFLLTNISSSGDFDHNSELHIFYADNLKSKNWQPIKTGNPVIFDSMRARNAGMFCHNGDIYRVNQVHGKAHYGKSFTVNKVTCLSESEFNEEPVSQINAEFKKDIISTHHFSANTRIAAIDYCRLQRLRVAKKS